MYGFEIMKSEKQKTLERQGCVFRGQEPLDNHELDPTKDCYCGRPAANKTAVSATQHLPLTAERHRLLMLQYFAETDHITVTLTRVLMTEVPTMTIVDGEVKVTYSAEYETLLVDAQAAIKAVADKIFGKYLDGR